MLVSRPKQSSGPYRVIPYGRNSNFTGRKRLLESVKGFSEGTAHSRIALYGLGGSGKTQVALEYVYQCSSENGCHVFGVHGSGPLKFSEDFRRVAHHVQIPFACAETDEEGFLLGITRWFEGPNSGDWILVIDNADNDADFVGNSSPVAKFIPQGTKGTVIFTTRSRQVASRQGCKMIEVGRMGEEEARELFAKRFGSRDILGGKEGEAIERILASMHHLPLAIIAKKLLSQEFCDIQREVNEAEGVLGTYFVTFNRIMQQMPPAAHLLRLIAFLDRQNIPEELLTESGLERMDDPVEFHLAIGKLLGFSLVTVAEHQKKRFYELHRLVQLSLQMYLPTEELIQWGATALGAVSRLFTRCEEDWRYVGPVYIPHALAVTKDSADPIAEELGLHMGRYFLDVGSYSNAEIQFRRCIELREEGHPSTLTSVNNLAQVLQYQGKYDESEAMNQRALEGREKILGPDHPDTLTSVNNLALMLRYQGKYDESEAMNRPSVGNLALVLQGQGKYDESEAMIRRALERKEKILGPDHPDTLTSVDNLAQVLQYQGKYDELVATNRRAMEGCEKILGPDHPDTLTSVNNLALVLRLQGKYDESEAMNRRALERSHKTFGPDHPVTLANVGNLALVLQGQGKYDESEAVNRCALERQEKILGPDHPRTLTNVHNLALVLQDQGKYDESEAMIRRALERKEKILGPDHPDTLTSVDNLAQVLQYQGKYDELVATNRRAMEGCEKILGPDHPDTLTSVNNLALVLRLQGKYDESEAMNRRALERSHKTFGPDHPVTLANVGNLALVLQGQGKYDESETMNRCALERKEKILGPDHPSTLTSVNNLAQVLQDQGKYDESEAMIRRALERREKILGPDHPDTLGSANNLALVLQYQGKYDESEAMNRRVREGKEKVRQEKMGL
ncbi:TPR-like protein [Tuber magnatum]|uniref:TPR-like protein n=1 Tax=Tuber magnatum TaxID=42249 RepID=A0A317SN25_9PEZI|nr:TPR-like protein [Tuber magnatum]